MITIEDFEKLIKYFEKVEVPAELQNFFDKLKLIKERNEYEEEVKTKFDEFTKRANELNENKGD